VRLIVWCHYCQHRTEPDPLAMKRATGVLELIEKIPVPGTDTPSPASLPMATSPDKHFLYVIREIEIWRVAVLMVNRYADEAEANSFQRAEELTAEGDHAGAAIWRRVTVAIEQLTDTTGPPN
jgi:hypothetical protein